ncbi:hypothetical protein F383_26615 [Gossypium arboreum]|uniref:Uncharacterized protein n=1 Tax=Gossypium arboreum TaxID=29729 RepID=A0A0B0P5G3_GOSAR|nr:hypothetical protein F383_26615 [Gossypium arboreum]
MILYVNWDSDLKHENEIHELCTHELDMEWIMLLFK